MACRDMRNDTDLYSRDHHTEITCRVYTFSEGICVIHASKRDVTLRVVSKRQKNCPVYLRLCLLALPYQTYGSEVSSFSTQVVDQQYSS